MSTYIQLSLADQVDPKALDWLLYTPPSDINFKVTLARANIPTLKQAIVERSAQPLSKTAVKVLTARLHRLEKEAVNGANNEQHSSTGTDRAC